MGHKKEKSLLERALAKEEINLAEYSLEEVKKREIISKGRFRVEPPLLMPAYNHGD